MATIKQGILGGFSGKIGNVVGSSWKGIATMKAKPLSVANPKTPAQTAQRSKLSQTVKAARSLMASLITIYWNPFAQRMSGYNRFTQENIAAFTDAGLTTFANFFSMRGSLVGSIVTAVAADASDSIITVTYTDNSGSGDALATDKVVATIYNADQDYWLVSDGTDLRDGGSLEVADANMVAGDTLHIYTGNSRADISKVSDSVYNTTDVVA